MKYKVFNGTDGQYRALHQWVERHLGKPKECWHCGSKKRSRYEWANMSGKYRKELTDWMSLCVSCHKLMDLAGVCRRGHELSSDTTYVTPSTGGRQCWPCMKVKKDRWNQQNPLRARTRRIGGI